MPLLRAVLAACSGLALSSCALWESGAPPKVPVSFTAVDPAPEYDTIDYSALRDLNREADTPDYLLGEGDKLTVTVWGRPETSGKFTIGPDGKLRMPLLGPVQASGHTPENVNQRVETGLRKFYKMPHVTIAVDEYTANRILLFGRVANPGPMRFDGPPMLFEALARAGTFPGTDKKSKPTKVAIFRGQDRVIWIDFGQMLKSADPHYNIRLRPNDVIYIPDGLDRQVYVMGEVPKQGVYGISDNATILEALMQAGGVQETSDADKIHLYRPAKKTLHVFSLADLREGKPSGRVRLEDGDILWVRRNWVGEIGVYMRQLAPGLGFATFANTMLKSGN